MIVQKPIFELFVLLDQAGLGDLATEIHQAIEMGPPEDQKARHEAGDNRLGRPVTSLAEQTRLAVRFLRSQLVEPALRLREAEQVGGRLTGRDDFAFILAAPASDGFRHLAARQVFSAKHAERLEALLPRLEAALLAGAGDEG